MKKVLSILLIALLLVGFVSPTSTTEASVAKEENIYALLDHDGSIKDLYVVNSFKDKEIIDYGDYKEIRNLSTTEDITCSEDLIYIKTDSDNFHYQGHLKSTELPWLINIVYLLDGNEISAKDLAGKSGKVEIRIDIKENKKENINPYFFKNFTLQISLQLDSRLFNEIEAKGGVMANAGMFKQINFTLLPNNEATFILKADTSNFELEPINISAIRMIMDMNIDKDALIERFTELEDAVKKIDDGSNQLYDGFVEFRDGLEEYLDGYTAFHTGLGQFLGGIDSLNNGSYQLSQGMGQLASQSEIFINVFEKMQEDAFIQINTQLALMELPIPELTVENYAMILDQMPQLADAKAQLDQVVMLNQGFKQYAGGLDQLSQAASQLNGGLYALNQASSQILAGSHQLNKGAQDLFDGAEEFKKGIKEFTKGTGEFKKETQGLGTKVSHEIDEMIDEIFGPDKDIRSFVSDKNTKVKSLQFAFKTEGIKVEVENGSHVLPKEHLTFWQKLLKLFGLDN